ncbi:MAG: hypothetical protein K0B06_04540 [Brevefilum sp.]|nr:hypothetical protein [Brevefilum sp.]
MLNKLTFILTILGVWFLAACAPSLSPAEPVITEAGVYFPQLAPMDEMPLALMYGPLVNDDGCLRVVANEGGESYLVLWPAGAEVIVNGGSIAIQDASGEIVARVDQQIGLVGGEYKQQGWVAGLLQPGRGLPEGCPGPYWLTGEFIEPEG